MFIILIIMSILLGVSSFACGILPLSFVFSKTMLDRLTALGTGLLLGAALGVIIPEGVEAAIKSNGTSVPTTTISLSLLCGFTFMFIIEQLLSPHSHSHQLDIHALHSVRDNSSHKTVDVEFDAELGDIEHDEGLDQAGYPSTPDTSKTTPLNMSEDISSRAFPLTFGLVIHGLADGLALGASSLGGEKVGVSSVSWVVFLALIIHKAPTSLALMTSLLAMSTPRPKCKRYLVVFASSTPFGAIASYLLFYLLGSGDDGWTGVALLVSGGTFLYVATVLQPVSENSNIPMSGEMRSRTRVFYIASGMFVPFLLSTLLGHGH